MLASDNKDIPIGCNLLTKRSKGLRVTLQAQLPKARPCYNRNLTIGSCDGGGIIREERIQSLWGREVVAIMSMPPAKPLV